MTNWISVEDKLPETPGTYIVFYNTKIAKIVDNAHWNPGWSTTGGYKGISEHVTHWQPLPAPPEEK